MSFSRRNFLSATAAGALAASGATTAAAEGSSAAAIRGGSGMKLSLAAYSFNRVLYRRGSGKDPSEAEMTLFDFVDYCAEAGLEGTELTGYYFEDKITDDYLLKLKQQTHRLGLSISGTAIGNDFCLPDGEARDGQLQMCRDWIDYAAMLGAPAIRVFAGKVPQGESEEVAVERCIAGMRQSLEYAAKKGVFLALENHGGITATPDQMMKLIDGCKDSPWFGVNFDSGNFRTDDPYRDLARIAPFAVNAQIKVAVTVDGKKQEADIPRTIQILKDAGYRGWVALEYEEPNPKENIPKYIAELRDVIG